MPRQTEAVRADRTVSQWAVIFLSVIAVILLLGANFSLWLNNYLFNRETFVTTSVEVFQKPAVRNAVGAEIVDQLFGDLPVVRQVVGEPVKGVISGFIASPTAKPLLRPVAEQANILLTAKEPQGIAFDISSVDNLLKPVFRILRREFSRTISLKKLPKKIVLLKKGEVPSIYRWGIVWLWAGPVFGLMGLGLIIGLVWRAGAEGRPRVLRTTGVVLALASLIFIFLAKAIKAPVLASISGSNVRIIADNIFDVFAGRLTMQTWFLVLVGALMTAAGFFLPRAGQTAAAKKLREFTRRSLGKAA